MDDNWFFNEQLWQEFYDCMFSAADFQQAATQLPALFKYADGIPERVLDLACGPGRYSLPLAQYGCQVTALDSSAYLLSKLRVAAQQQALNIDIIERDMREFARPQAFDLIICLWTSFGYFAAERDNLKVLERCQQNLSNGGILIIDTVGKEYLLRNLQPVHAREYDDGRLLIERPALDADMSRINTEWLLIDGDQICRTEFSHAIYTGTELSDRLQAVGFSNVTLYGDWQGGDYDINADRLIAVAKKIG